MKNSSLILLAALLCAASITFGAELPEPLPTRNIRTAKYRRLQARLARGWNTWFNDSVMTHAHLPEGFALNLCPTSDSNRFFLREVLKTSPEVRLGMRSSDGSYTSLELDQQGVKLRVETATEGDDELILVTPLKPSPKHQLVVEACLLYGRPGTVGLKDDALVADCPGRSFTVHATRGQVTNAYAHTTAPHLTLPMDQALGICTGSPRTLKAIKAGIAKGRAAEEARAARYGDLAESFTLMHDILSWNTIYDPGNRRVISPVSRLWSRGNWDGFVLFDWDTYFAGWMLSLSDKDLAMANAVEITKAITPDGFIPNYISAAGVWEGAPTSSWDRSQPPVGSAAVLAIYRRHPEKWFLEETYDELLAWNRWWPKARLIKGYLAWGSYTKTANGRVFCDGIQGAKWESGMDNSPCFDDVPFNDETHTLELADVGLMSLYTMDCDALRDIAKILGKTDDVKELAARGDHWRGRLATLWDEKAGIFLSKRTDTGAAVTRLTPMSFFPMLGHACTQTQVDRMIKEHYFNPQEFAGDYVMPSIARNDPAFPDNAYWRGRIWPPLNFLVYLGLRNYPGTEAARKDLIAKSKAMLLRTWRKDGSIFENYNSVNGEGRDDSTSKTQYHSSDAFYHWGALFTFMEFIEDGLMDAPGAR